MSKRQTSASNQTERRRDKLLLGLLETPPQPRPKRERSKSVSPKKRKAKKETLFPSDWKGPECVPPRSVAK